MKHRAMALGAERIAPHTRCASQVLDDLVAKLETMGPHHPDRSTLIRMILDREIDRRPAADPAGER
jgi:hypothetical protein